MATVFVTGGAGYVGSHACKALARAGHLPVVYDNLSRGHEWAVKWGPLEVGDLLDRERLASVLADHRPAAALHFAAFTYVGESVREPGRYWRNNVAGSLSLLEATIAAGIDALVFSSTGAVYGAPRAVPIAEDHPTDPLSPYAATKLAVERMLADFDAAHGLRSVALRYFNAAGADPEGELGEAHEPETHLIPLVLDAAAGRAAGIDIFGSDYDTPDGTCVRDFIHVSDLADAHVRALDWLLAGGRSEVFNLGTGEGHSVREVIEAVRRVTDRQVAVRTRPRRQGDVARLVADPAKARRVLGWKPERAALEAQIADAWGWRGSGVAAETGSVGAR